MTTTSGLNIMGEAWRTDEVNEEDYIEESGASLEHSLEKTGKLN